MKRVKIFAEEYNYSALEEEVNAFLEKIQPDKVLDIQYRDCGDTYISVMVVYEDERAITTDGAPRSFDDIYGKE